MEEEETATTELKLPMIFPYTKDEFYIRKSYPKYYKHILSYFEREGQQKVHYITISGTPGIGKSVFYMYVFKRMRKEFSDKIFITASFDQRTLRTAKLFLPDNEEPEELSSEQLHMIRSILPQFIYMMLHLLKFLIMTQK